MESKSGYLDSGDEVRQRLNYHVSRPVYTEMEFQEGYYTPPVDQPTPLQRAQKYFRKQCSCSAQCLKNFVFSKIPILDWLPKYQIRDDLLGDVLGGFTVAVMNIPQSMAFALLANMPPVYGLYGSFFPILVYSFFGTSKHMAFGTFGVVSLMAGTAVAKVIGPPPETAVIGGNDSAIFYNHSNTTDDPEYDYEQEKLLAITSLTLLVGLIQIILCIIHFGFVTVYLSTPVVRGFTTGAACHIFTSQIKFLFGLSDYIPLYSGPLALVYTYIDILKNLPNANYVEVILSACFIIAIAVSKYFADKYRPKLRFTIPVELLAVILGTLISYYMKLEEKHDVDVAGYIPTGIPAPFVPPGRYMTSFIGDAFAIAMVGFCVSVSMATIFAKNHSYEIDANQELLAYGLSNVVGSFFSCFVSACSLARMLIQANSGGKTQLAEIVNCIVILIVLLALAPLFEALPKAVLGSIVVVALKGMFKQCADLPELWRTSKVDFLVWIVTISGTVLLGVDIGLGVGVFFAIFMVILRTQRPNIAVAGNIPNTDIYRDVNGYKSKEISGIKIISSDSTLYYVNSEFFKYRVNKLTGINPVTIYANQQKLQDGIRRREDKRKKEEEKARKQQPNLNGESEDIVKGVQSNDTVAAVLNYPEIGDLHTIIIDCGNFNFIDVNGVNTLTALATDYQRVGVRVLLAGCQDNVKLTLQKCGYFDKVKTEGGEAELSFVTVHDAILFAQLKAEETDSL
ncbi:prestin-like isoform X2 [Ptychodera flava]|uniref:prestin-like isoform X2 n=1 Tax=Ptychodera flava TaxID=63121 RepID=UPI00396A7076